MNWEMVVTRSCRDRGRTKPIRVLHQRSYKLRRLRRHLQKIGAEGGTENDDQGIA
jgi:hypothetical protein